MPTARSVIKDALRALKVLAPGDMAHVDQLNAGLSGLQNLIQELHEGRGALRDVDVSADWIADENQRVRIEDGASVTVTLPNSVRMIGGLDPYDYGFIPSAQSGQVQGSTGPADGVLWRPPRDGSRIEIVGTTQQLFFYRADLNEWVNALDIRLDDEVPLAARYAGPLGAFLAERIEDELTVGEPSPSVAKRAAMARLALFERPGARRLETRASYF